MLFAFGINRFSHDLAHICLDCLKLVLPPTLYFRDNENELREEGGMLIVGLANGKVAVFPVLEFIQV